MNGADSIAMEESNKAYINAGYEDKVQYGKEEEIIKDISIKNF